MEKRSFLFDALVWGGVKNERLLRRTNQKDMDKFNIVLSPDNNYAKHAAVVMASVLGNCENPENVAFHILEDGSLSQENREKLAFVVKSGAEIFFERIDMHGMAELPESGYLTVNMWYRLCIASALPQNIERALYLDCDTVVNAPLSEIFNIDMRGKTVAGAMDCWWKKFDKRIGFPKGYRYFNSGVLLIDMERWRGLGIEKKLFDFLSENPEKARLLDQTVLNIVLQNEYLNLPMAYNFQYVPPFFEESCYLRDASEYVDTLPAPKIVHFVGMYKPWNLGLGVCNIYHLLYFRHLAQTPFAFASKAEEAAFLAASRRAKFGAVAKMMWRKFRRQPWFFFKPFCIQRIILELYAAAHKKDVKFTSTTK